jgi:hypothetical protein
MFRKSPFIVGLLSLCSVSLAEEEHSHLDIFPYPSNSSAPHIAVGGVTHATTVNPFTGEATADARRYVSFHNPVFGLEFGDSNPAFPHWTNSPGINADPATYFDADGNTHSITGTNLPAGTSLSLTITSDLQYFNGSTFSAVAGSEVLSIHAGPSSRVASAGTGVLAPLTLDNSADQIHLHLDSFLWGSADELANQTASSATPGIYLLTAILQSSSPTIGPSDTIYLVYNFNADESLHDQAIEYIHSTLIPEPAISLLPLAFLLRRRRNIAHSAQSPMPSPSQKRIET